MGKKKTWKKIFDADDANQEVILLTAGGKIQKQKTENKKKKDKDKDKKRNEFFE